MKKPRNQNFAANLFIEIRVSYYGGKKKDEESGKKDMYTYQMQQEKGVASQ